MSPNQLLALIEEAIKALSSQNRLFETDGRLVTLPRDEPISVYGDIHGDYDTLKKLPLQRHGIKVFLGDYVDRGPKPIDVLVRLMNQVVNHPHQTVLLRGNHEGPADVPVHPRDFPARLQRRYPDSWPEVLGSFQRLFDSLATAAVIPGEALLIHGGIPSTASTLHDLGDAHQRHPADTTLVEALWNDPVTMDGYHPSSRGTGRHFGPDVVEKFLECNGLKALIRGHESYHKGYHSMDRVLTLHTLSLPIYGSPTPAYLEAPPGTSYEPSKLGNLIRVT